MAYHLIHRKSSRFARGPLQKAIDHVVDQREIRYTTRYQALKRICIEIKMLCERYNIGVPSGEPHGKQDANHVTVYADFVGMVYDVERIQEHVLQ